MLLKLLAIINAQLSQAKKKPNTNTAVLGGRAIVILMRDFYQFLLVVGKPLREKAIITDELHSKAI